MAVNYGFIVIYSPPPPAQNRYPRQLKHKIVNCYCMLVQTPYNVCLFRLGVVEVQGNAKLQLP